MIEVELKFQVPPGSRDAVRRALRTRATKQTLHALYFDTAGDRLHAAGLSLRLRQEDRRWVQTLKAKGGAVGARLEHEVSVKAPARGSAPMPDLSRHDDTPMAHLLRDALKDGAELELRFETRAVRTARNIRHDGSLVALSLDEGEIRAGARSEPLFELEFELVRGTFAGLADLAGQWIEQHGAWIDARSKGDKGRLLAREQRVDPPTRMQPSDLSKRMTPDTAIRTLVSECLAHLLPNLTALSAGVAEPEHLHQTRVAVRRLRTALRHLGYWSDAVETSWEPDLAALLQSLGAARDRDALSKTLLPQLRAAGSPVSELPDAPTEADPGQLTRSPATNRLIVALVAFVHGAPPADAAPVTVTGANLRSFARPLLRRLHRQLLGDSQTFLGDTDARKHRTRRRLKRLRYCVEFMSPLFSTKRVKTYLQSIEPAQDALGDFNDAAVAQRVFQTSSEVEPKAWFAVGWLAARRSSLQQAAEEQLGALRSAPRFWRKHGGSASSRPA